MRKPASDLSPGTSAREHLPKSDFVNPKKKDEPGGYPISDLPHARAALGFAAMHHGKGSAIYKKVEAKVHNKFPGMGDHKAAAALGPAFQGFKLAYDFGEAPPTVYAAASVKKK